MTNPKIVYPKSIKNTPYHFTGLLFIMLNYIRHKLTGYNTPRTFSIEQIDQAINYDFKVAETWLQYLDHYTDQQDFFKDKVILELGPGADLGISLILLAMGVKKYIEFDVNQLDRSTPAEFYEKLLNILKNKYPNIDIPYLKEQLDGCRSGPGDRIKYIVDKNFTMSQVEDKVDIVFSQAAFEHFTDVEKTFRELSNLVKEGGTLVAEIDLKTHTRWIKDRDPLNIYRYNEFFWELFNFKGSPNRVRTFKYKELLEKNGWVDIEIAPLTILEEKYLEKIMPSLSKNFKEMPSSEMKMLSIILMAKKS